MKIQTNIRPRTDGTVTYQRGDQRIVFKPDESGMLCADVADEATIVAMLSLADDFEPADERDFLRAEQLLIPADAALEDEDEADPPEDSLPVEANTPPKRGRPRKVR